MTLRDAIAGALERVHARCCDSAEDRAAIADEVLAAIQRHPDAAIIRTAFAHADTGVQCIIVTRGIGGKREAEVLAAAARLAGLNVTEHPRARWDDPTLEDPR